MLLALETLAKITSYQVTFKGKDTSPDSQSSVREVTKDSTKYSSVHEDREGSDNNIRDNFTLESATVNEYFMEFMQELLKLFRMNRMILDKKGAFIIRYLFKMIFLLSLKL